MCWAVKDWRWNVGEGTENCAFYKFRLILLLLLLLFTTVWLSPTKMEKEEEGKSFQTGWRLMCKNVSVAKRFSWFQNQNTLSSVEYECRDDTTK